MAITAGSLVTKLLVLYPETEHGLRECQDELHDLLRGWIPEKLGVA